MDYSPLKFSAVHSDKVRSNYNFIYNRYKSEKIIIPGLKTLM